jgi:hypothetical protein
MWLSLFRPQFAAAPRHSPSRPDQSQYAAVVVARQLGNSKKIRFPRCLRHRTIDRVSAVLLFFHQTELNSIHMFYLNIFVAAAQKSFDFFDRVVL